MLAPHIETPRTIHLSLYILRERHALLNLSNRQRRVEALGARSAAVQNGVASVQAHAVVQLVLTLGGLLVTRVGDPTVRLHEDSRAEVLFAVPPVRWAGCAAAGAKDALVEAVELAAVFLGLDVLLTLLGCVSTAKVGDGRFVCLHLLEEYPSASMA